MKICAATPKAVTLSRPREVLLSLDRFEPAPRLEPLPSRPVFTQPEIPDVRGILARGLRYEELNQQITASYSQFSHLLQSEYDPGYPSQITTSPSWFGFGPWASRQAGLGMVMAGRAERLLEGWAASDNPDERLRAQAAELAGGAELNGVVDETQRICGLLLLGLTDGALDPRTIFVSSQRLLALTKTAPGANFTERLLAVARTARNTLEDGNRKIFEELGVSAQDFCHFRRRFGPGLTAEDVLDGFSLSTPSSPDQARTIYAGLMPAVEGDGPLPTHFDQFTGLDHRNFLVVGYALYQKAGSVDDLRLRNRLVEMAGILMAYREQHDIAQAAFTPGEVKPGEVDRAALFAALTPGVAVPLPDWGWSYAGFAKHLPARDHNPLTPRVTEYNWADFDDRWPGILDFFGGVFERPDLVWPMPPSDPMKPPGH
ncbi:MAG: hypothetical protein AB7S38_41530 [Vulcanimicrobiota bacterium]